MSARAAATSPAATRGKERSKVRLTPRAAILVFAVFLVAMFSIAPTRAYLDQRRRLSEMEARVQALALQNQTLQQRIAELNDPATLERMARECLGMVRPGETAFVTIPKGSAPTPPDCG
jgi:cell division protein FtsB